MGRTRARESSWGKESATGDVGERGIRTGAAETRAAMAARERREIERRMRRSVVEGIEEGVGGCED